MHQVEEYIVIEATPEEVWAKLMDLPSWSEWNTLVTSIKVQPPHEKLSVGSEQEISVVLNPTESTVPQVYTNVISKLEPGRELRWNGKILLAVLFDTEHWCILEPETIQSKDGPLKGTRFTQGERFTGLLAPVIGLTGMFEQLRQGYLRMNADLKRAVEVK